MEICKDCENRDDCDSPCIDNIMPSDTGHEEGERPYFDEYERCKAVLKRKGIAKGVKNAYVRRKCRRTKSLDK